MRYVADFPREKSRFTPARLVRFLALIGAFFSASPAFSQSGAASDPSAIRVRAEGGDVEAQNALGNALANGHGVAQDHAAAMEWYQRAAERNYAPALFNLGLAYELGRGTPANDAEAFKFYLRAAEQGYPPAQFNVANMYAAGRGTKQDQFEANLWYKQAADKGIVEAQYNLGLIYENGRGVRKDEALAARWYKQAADRGYGRAQYNLGLLHEDGRGVRQDDATAVALYRAAAEQGFAPAQNNLGLMYVAGRGGLAEDPVQAFAWLTVATEGGAPAQARDFLAGKLTEEQRAAAARQVGSLKERLPSPDAPAARVQSTDIEPAAGVVASRGVAPEDELKMLREEVRRAQGANNRFSEVNQQLLADKTRLEQEKAELEKWVASLERNVNSRPAAPDDSAKLRELNDEIARLRRTAAEAGSLRAMNERLELDNRRLSKAREPASQPDPAQQEQLATLTAQLGEARTEARRVGEQLAQREAELASARRELSAAAERKNSTTAGDDAVDRLSAQVAELTEINDRLEKDLDNARKTADAALAAQAQAVSAAQPDAYQMEINTLRSRVRQLEGSIEDERASAARELSSLAEQLGKARETARALTDANRSLLAAKRADDSPTRGELDAAQTRIRELNDITGELRRQNDALSGESRRLATERDELRRRLSEAETAEGAQTSSVAELTATNQKLEDERNALQQQIATLTSQLAEALTSGKTSVARVTQDNKALEERLSAIGAQLVSTQQELEKNRGQAAEVKQTTTTQAKELADAQTELAAVRSRLADFERAAATQGDAVAELTELNEKLTSERDVARAELVRAQQAQAALEQERSADGASAARNIDALTAQLAQARRELESVRTANQRLTESNAALERDRQATVAQLRSENTALAQRLAQAQNTLDQIAAAARLGTPASSIAAGGSPSAPSAPRTPTTASQAQRFHTVADGDSLSQISVMYYGTANRWQEIFSANRDLLHGANSLRVGQRLRIP